MKKIITASKDELEKELSNYNVFPFTLEGIKLALKNPISDSHWRCTINEEYTFDIVLMNFSEEMYCYAAENVLEVVTNQYKIRQRPLPQSVAYFYKTLRFWKEENPIRQPSKPLAK